MKTKTVFQVCLILCVMMVSFAATSPAYAHPLCGSSYVVQRGDWLARIARNCGVTLADLRAANPWTYNDRYIYPGEVLSIPGGDAGGTSGGSTGGACGPTYDIYGSYWVVCRGDTLGGIARYYGVSWRTLQQNNDIPNANLIYPGQIIRI